MIKDLEKDNRECGGDCWKKPTARFNLYDEEKYINKLDLPLMPSSLCNLPASGVGDIFADLALLTAADIGDMFLL